MSSYLPPDNNLPSFNSTVFKDNLTDEEIETQLNKIQEKTEYISVVSGETVLDSNLEASTTGTFNIGTDTKRFDLFHTNEIHCSNNTADTSVDFGNIETVAGVDSFVPQMVFDNPSFNTMYIGTAYDSGDVSIAGLSISIDDGSGDDPNVGLFVDRLGGFYIRNTFYTNNIRPNIDDSYDIGSSSFRFSEIFATNSTINTSDERQKIWIQNLDQNKMIDFISKLKPVSYKWKEGKNKETHTGLIAQDVKKAMPFDWGLYIHNEENDSYGLRYQELISPLICIAQSLIKQNEKMEEAIKKLESNCV
jgi:hypothetical protein